MNEIKLTPFRSETTISWSKSLDNFAKNDEVCSNEWRWSDDSTSYSSPKFIPLALQRNIQSRKEISLNLKWSYDERVNT
jgi:hypothetical protein